MYKFFSRYWWVLVLRGAIAILFGVLAFTLPMESLATLVVVFAAYVFADGVFDCAAAIAGRKMTRDWWMVLVQGLVSIGVGALVVLSSAITAVQFLLYIALWAVVVGALQLVEALELHDELTGEWWIALGGVVGMAFGALLVFLPEGALAVLWLIATYAIVWGAMLVIGGFDVHRLKPTAV